MLKLKNVSKFYYNKGVIASGFNKVNIEFDIGEFVAIVGESGSGKSTLLNVISGLDSYEEGEMYINGEETSHYRECDFEEYRKKYVSNIFQNFNLVNSYTVYQNIELVLLINGHKRKDVKKKVLELIDKVGLNRYKRTKVSKLSGGQKQRVAIARALAKDTPIIVADEPTGNLDSRSAASVIKLLKEISQDKLVIVVTHNLAEIEDIATRIVKMHDGKIVTDKKVIKTSKIDEVTINENQSIGLFNMIRLGIRNTFNIVPKFILIFIVFLFISTSLLSVYGSMKKSEYEQSKLGVNYFFTDTTDTRIIIKKKDGSSIKKEDFDNLKQLDNVAYVIENDISLDEEVWFESNDDNPFNFSGNIRDISLFEGKLDYGRMPENDNEVILLIDDYDYYFTEKVEEAVKKTYYSEGNPDGIAIKVVGIKYRGQTNGSLFSVIFNRPTIYGKKGLTQKYMNIINRRHSKITVNLNGTNHDSYDFPGENYDIRTSDRVPSGKVYVNEELNYSCQDYNCRYKKLTINISNLYYADKVELTISNVYDNKNVTSLLGISKDDSKYGSIFMNPGDYNKLFNRDSYQASIIANHVDNVDTLSDKLEDMGYTTLQIRKALNNDGADLVKVLKIIKLVVIIGLVVTLFFISYFVIKLILKSRNVYYSTLRILGANFKHIKRILDVELFINSSLAYIFYLFLVILVKYKIIYVKSIANIIEYLKLKDYIIMYLILVLMTYLISTRYASKIFKKSAMKTYREEV